MEDLYRLMAASLPPISENNLERAFLQGFERALLQRTSERPENDLEKLEKRALLRDASERFEKRTILQFHDDLVRGLAWQERQVEAGRNFVLQSFSTDPRARASDSEDCSVPLERLKAISFTEMQVGEVHYGRAVYGTLCAEPYKMCAIGTLLEDDNGLAVRLAIYNAAHSQEDIKKLYPMGKKVAVMEPYLKIANDGGFTIRVDNPGNVVNLMTQKGEPSERLLHLDVEDVRREGNRCFREQNWVVAAEHYTKCIDAALLQLKENFSNSNGNNNISTCLLYAYSNRAETWLQIKEFKSALEDSNEALRIDAGHLKALYRKGRALLGLRHYRAACECLTKADKISAGQSEIREALGQAKTLYAQSLNGKYDISGYLLGEPTSSPPEVADFVGRVEIKMTQDGRGRGLYATQKITSGELLLVSNAVAVAYRNAKLSTLSASQEDLVAMVVCEARKSQRLLHQLYSLHGSSTSSSLEIPLIDLFKTDGQMCEDQGAENEKLRVDVKRIREIVTSNCFGAGEVYNFFSIEKKVEGRLFEEGERFSGLWLLPSLINHSCLPNTSRRYVGSAMFIHASRPIERGEEITTPYFNVLVPFAQRQASCKRWGFKCKCRRCVLEHSLRTSMKPITARFEQMHDQAAEELMAKRSGKLPFDVDLPVCAEFASISLEAEKFLARSQLLEEEKNWIRASFMSAHLAGAESKRFAPMILNSCFPSHEKVMEAFQSTDPADFRNFNLAVWMLKQECRRWAGHESKASEQTREACISVFGRHCEGVVKALILKYMDGNAEDVQAAPVFNYLNGHSFQ